MHHRIAEILTHFEKRLGGEVLEDPYWHELKDLLDGPANTSIKFQVVNVSNLPGFGAYLAGSLRNDGSQQIDFSPNTGMVVLDVEAHFNDDAIQTEGGGCVDEVSNTHRRDQLVETLMHEFGHVLQDYFGQELHHVAIDRICDDYRKHLDEYRRLTHDFPGQHALSCWFGLSYASFLVLPRVLMEAMDDPWKERMAVLLNEMGAEFPNVPEENYTVRVTDGKNGNRMVKTPEWMLNYRHPDRALINSFRKQEAYAKKLQEADNG